MKTPDSPAPTLRELVAGIPFAMLTTRGANGVLHCRPMAAQQEEDDGALWFFAGSGAHKTTDIAAHPQVNVSYSDHATHRYVSVCGRAEAVADPDEIRRRWRPAFAAWFPQGVNDPDLVLIRVAVESADYWQSPSTWIGRTLAFARELVTGEHIPEGSGEGRIVATPDTADTASLVASVAGVATLSPADLLTSLQWRYAVKRFDTARRIPAEQWAALQRAMVLSPSSYGLQPWLFLVVDDALVRERLFLASMGQRKVMDSSHLVVFAARTDITDADVGRWIARLGEARHLPVADLEAQREAMRRDLVTGPRHAIAAEWARRQAYIALGVFLTSAAVIGVDTCPMEGFDPKAYDDILGLSARGYTTAVVATAGYRSADDHAAAAAKVRFPDDAVLIRV